MSMKDCKPCHGTGIVHANGAARQCPNCQGWGYVGVPSYIEPENVPLSFKQALVLAAVCAAIILVAFVIGSPP